VRAERSQAENGASAGTEDTYLMLEAESGHRYHLQLSDETVREVIQRLSDVMAGQ